MGVAARYFKSPARDFLTPCGGVCDQHLSREERFIEETLQIGARPAFCLV
jgi:hypothetical protein